MKKAEELLEKGVEPEVISEIVMVAQYELLCGVLYMLDDNLFAAEPKCSDELHYGLFETDVDQDGKEKPKGRSWSLDHDLAAARPGNFPPIPGHDYFDET